MQQSPTTGVIATQSTTPVAKPQLLPAVGSNNMQGQIQSTLGVGIHQSTPNAAARTTILSQLAIGTLGTTSTAATVSDSTQFLPTIAAPTAVVPTGLQLPQQSSSFTIPAPTGLQFSQQISSPTAALTTQPTQFGVHQMRSSTTAAFWYFYCIPSLPNIFYHCSRYYSTQFQNY